MLNGKKIQELRKATSYSQEQLAERAGIERATLSRIETNSYKSAISLETIDRIACALGVTVYEIAFMSSQGAYEAALHAESDKAWNKAVESMRRIFEGQD